MLNPAYRQFAQAFAIRIIEADFVGAQQLLAPWLRQTMTAGQIRDVIQKEVQEVAEANELAEAFHPRDFDIDSNSCTLDSLKAEMSYREPRQIPSPVTEENFRQWMVIQFQPNQQEQTEFGIDAWLDWWMIVVEVDGAYRIGFFEIEVPD